MVFSSQLLNLLKVKTIHCNGEIDERNNGCIRHNYNNENQNHKEVEMEKTQKDIYIVAALTGFLILCNALLNEGNINLDSINSSPYRFEEFRTDCNRVAESLGASIAHVFEDHGSAYPGYESVPEEKPEYFCVLRHENFEEAHIYKSEMRAAIKLIKLQEMARH